MSQLDDLRTEIMQDIARNRWAWRLTMLPQIIILSLLATALCIIAGYGLYVAVLGMNNPENLDSLAKASKIFLGSGSSILGFVVIRLFGKLTESSKVYLHEEKNFTRFISRTRLTTSRAGLGEILVDYGKK